MKLRRIFPLLLTAVIVIGVGWFYYWTTGSPRAFAGSQGDYYNLLVDGFQDGQLAMKVTPDPWMGVDATKVTHYLHDASFHGGKYYLYFGVTPALLLVWPWTAITGHDLPEAMAVTLTALLAYGLSLGWLRTLQRRFVSEPGFWFWPLAALMLGIGAGYPVVLRRPLFYELAILSGVACSMAGLWCLTLAILRRERAVAWLAAGSLFAGLAAGSRPTFTPGAVLAVALAAALVGWTEARGPQGLKVGRAWRLGLAAVLPAGFCGVLLAWYNWARFGSPLEFGLTHQVGSNPDGFSFTLGSLWRNLDLYYFTAPSFSWFFPFFGVGTNPPGIFREQAHGQLFIVPVLLLAAAAGVRAWRRHPDFAGRAVLVVVATWTGIVLLLDCMAPPHANRYQLDFHPVLLVGMLLGLAAVARERAWRWPVRAALAWCGVVVGFNVLTSFSVHGFFRADHPQPFAQLARVADRLVWPLHRLAGPRLGGMELSVTFAEATPGRIEPLVVTGSGPDMDAVVVKYTGHGRGRLAFLHLDHGEVEGVEFDLLPGRERSLQLHLGSLYPPVWHPWYESLPPGIARATGRVSATLDGVKVLDRDVVCYQASANQVRLGERGDFLIGAKRFSGRIERRAGLKADLAWWEQARHKPGALRLRLQLPRDRYGLVEPLVLTGELGRRDFLGIDYVRPRAFRLVFLHEGWQAPVKSREIAWDYLQPLEVRLDMGALRADDDIPANHVVVAVNGEEVLREPVRTHPAGPGQIYVGAMPQGFLNSRLLFGGQILAVTPTAPKGGRVAHARQELLAGRPVNFRVVFPAGPATGSPLLSTGAAGRGDSLYVEPLAPEVVRFGFDHWGSKATLSAPIRVVPGRGYDLAVSLEIPPMEKNAAPGRLEVRLDGQVVFATDVQVFSVPADRIFFGTNPAGMSTSGPEFSGQLSFQDEADGGPR